MDGINVTPYIAAPWIRHGFVHWTCRGFPFQRFALPTSQKVSEWERFERGILGNSASFYFAAARLRKELSWPFFVMFIGDMVCCFSARPFNLHIRLFECGRTNMLSCCPPLTNVWLILYIQISCFHGSEVPSGSIRYIFGSLISMYSKFYLASTGYKFVWTIEPWL